MSNDSENKLDELFRNRFEEAELPVSDKLLSTIKQELGIQEKKKRRFGFWIWWLGGLGAVVFGAVFYLNNNEDNKTNFVSAGKPKSAVDVSSSEYAELIEPPPQQEQQEIKEKTIESNAMVEQQDVKEQSGVASNAVNENASRVETAATTVAEVSKNKQENKEYKSDQNTLGKASKKADADNKKTITANAEKNSSTITEKQSAEIKTTDEQADSAIEKIAVKDSILPKKQIATATQQPDSILVIKDTVLIAETKPNADSVAQENKPQEPQQSSKDIVFYVEGNGALSQSFRTLENKSSADRTGEKPWLIYNAEINVGVLFKNKYQVSVGLGIDNKGEKYKFSGKDALYQTTIDTSYSIVFDTIIDSVWIWDTVPVYEETTTQLHAAVPAQSVINKYQYIKVPVMFGYRFNVNDKFFITPNAGVIINYLVTAQATWFDPALHQYIIYDTRDKYRTLVFAARAKIDIGYRINEKWSVLLQPAYTRYLSSIFRKEDYFKQYPYSYDVNIGIRYTF